MDEMNNMNETTVEMETETPVEVVPNENVVVNEPETNSEAGANGKLLVGGVIAGAAVVYGLYKHHKAKKSKADGQKPKTKKKIHLRNPFVITEEVEAPEEEAVENNVEETSEEE